MCTTYEYSYVTKKNLFNLNYFVYFTHFSMGPDSNFDGWFSVQGCWILIEDHEKNGSGIRLEAEERSRSD